MILKRLDPFRVVSDHVLDHFYLYLGIIGPLLGFSPPHPFVAFITQYILPLERFFLWLDLQVEAFFIDPVDVVLLLYKFKANSVLPLPLVSLFSPVVGWVVLVAPANTRVHTCCITCNLPRYPIGLNILCSCTFIHGISPPTANMPVSKVIINQIKQIIPPLNGTLHKGQSGAWSRTAWASP